MILSFLLFFTGETKTLLSFDGCAQHLGCTIVLRGGSKTELWKVSFFIDRSYMCYKNT